MSNEKKENYETLKKHFENAIVYLSNKVKEEINDIETEYELKDKSLKCIAISKTKPSFSVSIETDPDNVENLSARISIPYGLQKPFVQYTQIPKYSFVENRLIHWMDLIIYTMNLRYNSVNLDTLFNGDIAQIHTEKPYTLDELHIFLDGVQENFKTCNLIIYKFEHIDQCNHSKCEHNPYEHDQRWFSYAFSDLTNRPNPFWILFLKIGGLDDDKAKYNLEQFENVVRNVNMRKIEKTFYVTARASEVKFLI